MSKSKAAAVVACIAGWFLMAIMIAGVVYLYFNNPYEQTVTICIFNRLTGLLCPACGLTRALYSLLHLDIPGALRSNILVLFIPVIIYGVFAELSEYMIGKKLKGIVLNRFVVVGLSIFILIYTVIRNLMIKF